MANYTQKPINPKLKTQNFMKLGDHMRQMILNKHATFYGNSTIGGAITVINVKNNVMLLFEHKQYLQLQR